MKILKLIILLLLLQGCKAKKDVRYFQDLDVNDIIANTNTKATVFQANDLLKIYVSSPDNIGVAPFNLTETSYKTDDEAGTSSTSYRPYLVKEDGTIDFPVLGKIQIAGKTKEEVINMLKDRLRSGSYINEPMVHIDMVNFRISVLGDVGNPGVFTVLNERITILEAVAMAGDLNITGKREDVVVVRESEGTTNFIKVNFLSDSLFTSPAYYLNQNDVVYVKPNDVKTREASWDTKIPVLASLAAFSLSVISLFLR